MQKERRNDMRDLSELQASGLWVDGERGLRDLLAGSALAIQRALFLMRAAPDGIDGSYQSPQQVGAGGNHQ